MAVIGISGSYGGRNLGDEAILGSILAALRQERPHDELIVFTRNPEHTQKHHDADMVVAARDKSRDEVAPVIERMDLFLLGGGGILFDGEARAYLRDVRLAHQLGVPTFAYAVGAGPLDDPEDREIVGATLNDMGGVAVRDETSKRTLEDVGVTRPIEVTADPAVLLAPAAFTPEMLAREGIEGVDRLIGMSVREPGKAAPTLDEEAYHALLAQAADFIVHRYDADVVYVAMERDDIRHSHQVIAQMQGVERAHVLKRAYEPQQILGLMEHLDLVVGMRLHFVLFAALAGVPFLPLPYASKVADFAERLEVASPGRVDRQSVGSLIALIDHVWDHRSEHRARLVDRIAPMLHQARRTLGMALALLDGGSADGRAASGG